MFEGLKEEIRLLNSDVNNVANSEKAKELRNKLLKIGIPLAIIGFGGSFLCFVLFGTVGFMSLDASGFNGAILIPFFLMIPLFLLGSVGGTLISLALKIVITGYTSNLVEETVWERCPKCGDRITKEELFCNKCGHQLRKKCPKCDFINEPSNNYCVKCGEKL